MDIPVIDNGGQWTHKEWRVLRDLGVSTQILPNTTRLSEIRADGLVLSGGAPRVGLHEKKMGRNGEYLDGAEFPVLGICAGLQFMAIHFGGEAHPAITPEFGKASLTVEIQDALFSGLPAQFEVWESHNDEVTRAPDGFEILARSADCPIQAIRSLKRPLYGVQFHPEVEDTKFGREIFQNFVRTCEEWRR